MDRWASLTRLLRIESGENSTVHIFSYPQLQLNSDVEAVRVEALTRLGETCGRDRLRDIYETIESGEHYEWAINQLRGAFFEALAEEYDHLLAKTLDRGAEHGGGEVQMGEATYDMLQQLGRVANLYTEVVTSPAEVIPQTLGPLLQIHDVEMSDAREPC